MARAAKQEEEEFVFPSLDFAGFGQATLSVDQAAAEAVLELRRADFDGVARGVFLTWDVPWRSNGGQPRPWNPATDQVRLTLSGWAGGARILTDTSEDGDKNVWSKLGNRCEGRGGDPVVLFRSSAGAIVLYLAPLPESLTEDDEFVDPEDVAEAIRPHMRHILLEDGLHKGEALDPQRLVDLGLFTWDVPNLDTVVKDHPVILSYKPTLTKSSNKR
jgi:hypothetical protein